MSNVIWKYAEQFAGKAQEIDDEIERLREAVERIATYKVDGYKAKGHYCAYRSAIDGMKQLALNALAEIGEE